MKHKTIDEFYRYISDIQFLSVDDLYSKIDIVKSKYKEMYLEEKEIYKWYFFNQLNMNRYKYDKILIKDAFWDYLNDNCEEELLKEVYYNFCKDRDNKCKRYKECNLTRRSDIC